jgi:hypothetical protein
MEVIEQLHNSATVRRKSPHYPLDGRLGEPHSQSGRSGEEKIPAPAGNRKPVVHSIA